MYRRGDFVLAPTFGETAKALKYLSSPSIRNRDEDDTTPRRPLSAVSQDFVLQGRITCLLICLVARSS